jgi:hypothetical protein
MAIYAVIVGGIVDNVIVADSLEIAEALTQSSCVEFIENASHAIGDKLSAADIKKIEVAKAKREADKAKAEALAEAERVKAIEAENERLRQAEAERLAAEEAAKPKPVTGIFVKVSQN